MDPCFKYNLKMSSDSQNIKCLMAFCHTCLINYKNKNKLAAFHDTKLAILKQSNIDNTGLQNESHNFLSGI